MGQIADLFEKKALGTITDEEAKTLENLLVEAKTASEDKKEDKEVEVNADDEAEAMAQKFADAVTGKMGDSFDKMSKLFEKMTEASEVSDTADKTGGSFYDKALGKKVTVAELSEQKILIPGRKEAGKGVTEVSKKTVYFLQALTQKNVEKLQLLSEGTAQDGGFLVPEEFANMIIEDVRDQNIMRQIARSPITISSDTFHLPNLASRPQAAWRNEKAVKNTSTANFGENVFTPYSLAVIVGLSNELVSDASMGVGGSIVSYVSGLMSTAVTEKEEQAFWTGSGSGQPSGVDGGVYSLRTVNGGITDSSRADAVIAAYFRTPQGFRGQGVWVANSSTWEKVNQLKDTQGNYLVSNLASAVTPTLKGRPIYESNYLAGGTLLYGAFNQAYQIVDREGISVRVSDEATVAGSSAFEKNLTFIRVEKRVDAEVVLPSAITKVTSLGQA